MNYTLTQGTAFPLAEVTLSRGEEIQIERGSMVYHMGGVELEGKVNGGGGGLGGLMKAVGRSIVSGESMFITRARGLNDGAKIAIAPSVPGMIHEITLGREQWRVRDAAFLACDADITYEMKRQSFGKALLGGTGGFFIMETRGAGTMLLNSYGDVRLVKVNGAEPLVVDNTHVVAWSTSLEYEIRIASGTFGFTTGEGLVNEFRGTGSVLVQTRNIQSLAEALKPYLPQSH